MARWVVNLPEHGATAEEFVVSHEHSGSASTPAFLASVRRASPNMPERRMPCGLSSCR